MIKVDIKKVFAKLYIFVKTKIKDIQLQFYYKKQDEKVNINNLKEKLNNIYINLISLINDGSYSRFNSFDYLNKSSKINLIINELDKLHEYYDLKPNERSAIRNAINRVSEAYPSLKRTGQFILINITRGALKKRILFINVRNFIASEWMHRNIKGPDSKINQINLKDLNYLNYTIEEYQEYLHNCLNMLIRDTKRFISRYPEEYKLNPDIDLELLTSLRHTIYNDFKFTIPSHIMDADINSVDLFNLIEKETDIITIKGWFRDKPKSDYINVEEYKAYRKNIRDEKLETLMD